MAYSPMCTGCGAPLPIAPGVQQAHCSFCGRTQLIGGPPVQAPPQWNQGGYGPQAPHHRPPSGTSPALVIVPIVMVLGLFLLAGAGAAFWATSRGAPPPSSGGGIFAGSSLTGDDGDGPGSGGVVPPGEHMQWSSSGLSVVPVTIDDDGVEDFVGLYRVLDLGGGGGQTLHAGGFDGKTFERRWATPSFGTLGEGITATHLGLAGRRVVVTDFRNTAHVIELSTGRAIGDIAMTDRARSVCSPRDGGTEVWIEVADDADLLVDLQAMTAKRAPRPAWCPEKADRGCATASATCKDGRAAPSAPGFRADLALFDGALGVAVGAKSPGTPTPMAIGFDPRTKAVRWQLAIPADPQAAQPASSGPAELAGGALYATYDLTDSKGSRLVAMSADTGARRWEITVPRSGSGSGPSAIVVSATRVYVPHWTWLDVLDVKDGKHLATVGMW